MLQHCADLWEYSFLEQRWLIPVEGEEDWLVHYTMVWAVLDNTKEKN